MGSPLLVATLWSLLPRLQISLDPHTLGWKAKLPSQGSEGLLTNGELRFKSMASNYEELEWTVKKHPRFGFWKTPHVRGRQNEERPWLLRVRKLHRLSVKFINKRAVDGKLFRPTVSFRRTGPVSPDSPALFTPTRGSFFLFLNRMEQLGPLLRLSFLVCWCGGNEPYA